jgi:SET domain-containing protein
MSIERIDAKEKNYLYLAVSQITNAGQGLFSSIPIYKDEVISLFKGEALTAAEAARRAKKGEDAYFINCLDGSILDSMHTSCFAKYANDPDASGPGMVKNAFKSNADISVDDEDNICLIATRNIKMGEEVFCNYGKQYWKNFHRRRKTV